MNILLVFRLFSVLLFVADELKKAGSDGEITINELIEIFRKAVVRFSLANEKIKINDILEVLKNVKF